MSKHTPGPWKLSGANTVHGMDCIVAFVGTADEEVRRYSGNRQSADARLIAAAPDLLAVCEHVRDTIREFLPTVMSEDLTAIEAAIAKARGES